MLKNCEVENYDTKNFPEFIVLENKKISERALNSKSKITLKLIDIVNSLDYELYTHKNKTLEYNGFIFTLIILVYEANLKYIQECISSALDQTYKNIEIVLINNGAKGKVREFVLGVFFENKNVKYIETKHNLFNLNPSAFSDPVTNLHNGALFCSEGDYVYWLSYDDKISINYVESMIKLFKLNPNCGTAASAIQSIDSQSDINVKTSNFLKENNCRDQYTKGIELCKSNMKKEKKVLFPGQTLAVKSQIILDAGCFDIDIDLSQLYKFAIQSDSGFAPEAILFWRHHSDQLNIKRINAGVIAAKCKMEFYFRAEIEKFHKEKIGIEFAKEFKEYYLESVNSSIKICIANSFAFGGLIGGGKSFINLLKLKPVKLIFCNLHYYFFSLFKSIFIFPTLTLIKKFKLTNNFYYYLKSKFVKVKNY